MQRETKQPIPCRDLVVVIQAEASNIGIWAAGGWRESGCCWMDGMADPRIYKVKYEYIDDLAQGFYFLLRDPMSWWSCTT